MAAWFAKTNAFEYHLANVKLPAHEMIQGDGPGHEIPASLARSQLNLLISCQRLDRFHLDQGHLAIRTRRFAERAVLPAVTIAVKTATDKSLYRLDRHQVRTLF